jgi:hypothetical protein
MQRKYAGANLRRNASVGGRVWLRKPWPRRMAWMLVLPLPRLDTDALHADIHGVRRVHADTVQSSSTGYQCSHQQRV